MIFKVEKLLNLSPTKLIHEHIAFSIYSLGLKVLDFKLESRSKKLSPETLQHAPLKIRDAPMPKFQSIPELGFQPIPIRVPEFDIQRR